MDKNVLFALSLTVIAGMATGLGSILALFTKRSNTKFLASSLGFSAGVMIYVSMVEIFQKSRTYLSASSGDVKGYWYAVAAFFAGILFIGLIDFFVPSTEGDIGNLHDHGKNEKILSRMGFMTALAIGIHNFPEGMATFTSALKEPHLGIAIGTAIFIHNIPDVCQVLMKIYNKFMLPKPYSKAHFERKSNLHCYICFYIVPPKWNIVKYHHALFQTAHRLLLF